MRLLRSSLRALLTVALFILLATAGRAASAENLVTCDELPPQPTNGVHVNGVEFYTYEPGEESGGLVPIASYYGDEGPGITAYVQDPSIVTSNEYTYNILGMQFDTPTNNLQFGIALDEFGTFPDGACVDLYSANEDLLGTFPLTTSSQFSYTEALFNYSGAPVKWAEVYINPEVADAYAVDNIRFGNLVTRTQASGEGTTATVGGTRFTAVLSVRATTPGRGTGAYYAISSGTFRTSLRSLRLNTVMLFGNRAVITGLASVQGVGVVPFSAEIIDGGPQRGADRVTVSILLDDGPAPLGPLPIATGDFRVR
jgi:hypothetical protein